jgi:23S rRNA (uracil1939-C5)-methyltransferase
MASHRRAARPAPARRATGERPVTERPVVRLAIERLVAGGDALARQADGRIVFVPGALPGEVVDVRILGMKRDFGRGELVDVVEPSAHRVAAPCPARALGCGGCDWQHLAPHAQLDAKVEIVREAMRRTARLPDAVVAPGATVDPWAYRTSMRFSVDADGRPSLRRARTNDDIALDGCPIAHPALAALLPTLRLPGADEVSLRVSAATGERTAWWEPEHVVAAGLPADVAAGAGATLVERIAGVDLRVSAPSFFQSGPAAAELLVQAVRSAGGDELRDARRLVDAYGGVGLFAATVAPNAAHVVLVEGSPSACADARINLAGRSASIIESPVELAGELAGLPAADLRPGDAGPSCADVVIADPSRQGLGADAVGVVARWGAPVLVLVSCDPVSLARDAALLAQAGYRHTVTTVLDLFPQTHHVEAVTRFERVR